MAVSGRRRARTRPAADTCCCRRALSSAGRLAGAAITRTSACAHTSACVQRRLASALLRCCIYFCSILFSTPSRRTRRRGRCQGDVAATVSGWRRLGRGFNLRYFRVDAGDEVMHGQEGAPSLVEEVIDGQEARKPHILEVLQNNLQEDAPEGFLRPSLAVKPRFRGPFLEAAALSRVLAERRAPESVEQRDKQRLLGVPAQGDKTVLRNVAQQPEP